MSKNFRIKELENNILEARHNYYNSQPTVSDLIFDAWIDELRTLDPTNKAVVSVGAPVAPSEWKKAKHQIPMGSLDKVNTIEEFREWCADRAPGEDLMVVEKLDGLSIELVYENGKLAQGITRGDGTTGEDITINVIKMGGVQRILSIDFTGSLRGEIILTKTKHKQFFADKANPRNTASGVSKRLDSVGAEHLDILLYQVIGNVDFQTEEAQFDFIKSIGCKTPNHRVCKLGDVAPGTAVDAVVMSWQGYQSAIRDTLDYDIDGLVVRINDMAKQLALGDKDMRPKGAIAWKFENEARETILLGVEWQVGNSGRITPVAIVEPIMLCGAEVKRASLHNVKWVEKLDLYIGCKVLVSRRNDVIPYVEEKIA